MYQVSDDEAFIFTTDFFTPIVDDPYDYGAIAAANALSDVYAMGGDVLLALNIACFPETMDEEMIRQILLGGAEKVREAGGAIAGGHTIDDEEPKYGLAVMGRVHPDHVLEKSGACEGDVLVLTKPLGAGLITTALKGDMAETAHIDAAVKSMSLLNKAAGEAARQSVIHAATDVTGFALVGHALELAGQSRVKLVFRISALPFLPGVESYADMWLFPAGTSRNREAFESRVSFSGEVGEEMRAVLFTPETSGGLLLAMPRDELPGFTDRCRQRDQQCWEVGEVQPGQGLEFLP